MKTALILFIASVVLAALAWRALSSVRRSRTPVAPPLTLQPTGQNDFGPCPHCGDSSRAVWGFVQQGEATRAAYFVHWTLGVSEHPANFDLILGPWGESSAFKERVAVSLIYRDDVEMRSFMVVDAAGRKHAAPELVGRALSRAEVVGTPLAEEVFALADLILLQERRLGTIKTKPPAHGT